MFTPSKAYSAGSEYSAVSNSRRWGIVLLLYLASLINYFDRATLSFALPLISTSLGLTATQEGLLLSSFFWSYSLMQMPIGLLSDRVNLKWVYAAAFTLWSLAQGFTGLATGLGTLIVFRVILGIGESIYLPGGTKVVSLLFPLSERGLPCGIFDAGTRTGLVLEALLVPWMLTRYGWRTTFAVIGFSALLWLIPWLLMTPRQLRANPPEPTNAPAAFAGEQAQAPARYRDLLGVFLGYFCFDYFWFLLLTWLPTYLKKERGFTYFEVGIGAALPFLVFGVTQPLGGWLGDRLVRAGWNETRTRKAIISVAFSAGLLLIPAAQAQSSVSTVLLFMGACLVGLSTANQLVILQSCAPSGAIGFWTGAYNFIGNLAGVAAPLVTGFLIDRTGSYTPAFVLAGVMIAAGQLCYWFLVGEVTPQKAAMAQSSEPAADTGGRSETA